MKTKLLFFATMLTCMLLSPGKIHASDMPDAVYSNEIAAMHRPTHDIDRFIKKKYPGCRIIDRDYDDGHLEVKIGHKGTEKTLIFNRRHDWVRTVWELRRTQLPKTVVKAMERMGYSFRHIDDNDNMAVETPDGRFYAVQVDTDRRDHIYIGAWRTATPMTDGTMAACAATTAATDGQTNGTNLPDTAIADAATTDMTTDTTETTEANGTDSVTKTDPMAPPT